MKQSKKKNKKKSNKVLVLVGLAGTVLITGLVIMFVMSRMEQSSRDAAVFESVKNAVAKELLNPESAEFRKLSVTKTGYCGEVNSINPIGVPIGFRRFYASEKTDGEWLVEFNKRRVDSVCKP